MSPSRVRARAALAVVVALLLGCALGDLWWTHPSAGERDFLKVLGRCRSQARLALAERENSSCRYDSRYGVSYCAGESEHDRVIRLERERLMKEDLKNDCMEAHGFTRSARDTGFRERRASPRLPDS